GGVTFRRNEHHAFRYRAIVDLNEVEVDPAAQTGFYSPGGWLSVIPIGNGKAYWFGSATGATNFQEFKEFFRSWKKTHIPRTLNITPEEAVVESPLYDVAGLLYKWTYVRITLMGDAAHPMMPDLAQGASQAFIDALALSDVFSRHDNVKE